MKSKTLPSRVISSATEEIWVIFSTVNTFRRYERESVIELLTGKTNNDGVNIRILLEYDQYIQDKVKTLVKTHSSIVVHHLDRSIQTKVTTFLIDNELSLIVELKDDAKENSNEAIGLATYSNSESTVLSYASIFETLWLSSKTVPIAE